MYVFLLLYMTLLHVTGEYFVKERVDIEIAMNDLRFRGIEIIEDIVAYNSENTEDPILISASDYDFICNCARALNHLDKREPEKASMLIEGYRKSLLDPAKTIFDVWCDVD